MQESVAMLPIPGEWIVQGGAVAMLGLVVLMILRGALVPRRTFEQLEREKDHWRAVAFKAMAQSEALLPAAQITTKVAHALIDVAAPDHSPPGEDGGGTR